MSLRSEQSKFARDIGLLILYAYSLGYEITFGDFWRPDKKGHKKDSNHYIRMAADLNLFKNGVYLQKTRQHKKLGEFWKNLDPKNRWGGDFTQKDGNHYSRVWRGRS
jgi:hypothetical protein